MTDPARAFAAKVLRAYHSDESLSDLDLETAAIRLGLFVNVEAQEPCGPKCRCEQWEGPHEFPTDCLRMTDAAKALLAEYPE